MNVSLNNRETTDYGIFILCFFALNPITFFGTSDFILVFISAINTYYLFIYKKEKIDNILLYVLIYWTVVNFFSYMILRVGPESDFKFSTFIGSYLKLYIAYTFMKVCGARFIYWFEKTVRYLAIISLLFFIIQLVYPAFFYKIPFNLADPIRLKLGHWNGLIFNYSTFHLQRNSGFAGEPGTFGYYIGLAMIFNLILHENKMNKNFFILASIGLTTLSTNFYASLILFGLFFISSSPLVVKGIYLAISIVFILYVYNLPFIGDKIETYMADTQSFEQSNVVKAQRINRMATFVNNLHDVGHYPLGYGLNTAERSTNIYNQVIDGTNGLSRIAVRFGFFGLIYFLIIYFQLLKKISLNTTGHVLFTLIMLMYISANPMERDYFAMALFWLFFIIEQEDVRQLIKEKNGSEEWVTSA